jgi:hypothetical protein
MNNPPSITQVSMFAVTFGFARRRIVRVTLCYVLTDPMLK